jgi:molybdate transport system regulatory protein
MKISARNVLLGKVQNVIKGAVNAEVTLSLQGEETVVAIISSTCIDDLHGSKSARLNRGD